MNHTTFLPCGGRIETRQDGCLWIHTLYPGKRGHLDYTEGAGQNAYNQGYCSGYQAGEQDYTTPLD